MAIVYLQHCTLDGASGHDAGRRLLLKLWDSHVGGQMPPIVTQSRGKPCFAEGTWHFSISHTKHHAFCALSDVPIGIDAEEIDRKIDLRLADKILSPHEKAQFDTAENQRLALLQFWVLKEAAGKFTGDGLRGYPNHTNFTLNDSRISVIDGCFVAMIQEDDHVI